jgi:subtilisin family serine protease
MVRCRKPKKNRFSLFPYKRIDVLSLSEAIKQYSWSITAFDLPSAWRHAQGEGVTIAVLDTGCDLTHDELKENILQGYNFVNPGTDPQDDNDHGTHVTGTICADNDNHIVGIAPKAKVRPVKVLDSNGNGNLNWVAQGIHWAVDQKVDIISMSLGCPRSVPVVWKEIKRAYAKGISVFVAAGNAGNTQDVFFPAAYPETIAIGAIDKNLKRASFSNTGPNLDFMAPGVDILSCVPKNWYAVLSGTSMAQPFACGVAALLLSYAKNTPNSGITLNNMEDYKRVFQEHTT